MEILCSNEILFIGKLEKKKTEITTATMHMHLIKIIHQRHLYKKNKILWKNLSLQYKIYLHINEPPHLPLIIQNLCAWMKYLGTVVTSTTDCRIGGAVVSF